MITLAQIEETRKKIAVPQTLFSGSRRDRAHGPKSWVEYDQGQTSFATILFGMAPELFKLYDEMWDSWIGFEVNKSGVLMSTEIPRAEHEIAHWLEMSDPNRWLLPNWGITWWSFDEKEKSALGKLAALSREARVFAINAHMFRFIREPHDPSPERFAEGKARWSTEVFLKPFSLPLGKFKTEKEIHEWFSHLWMTTFNAWNLDRIEHEFKKRIEHVREFMETKED